MIKLPIQKLKLSLFIVYYLKLSLCALGNEIYFDDKTDTPFQCGGDVIVSTYKFLIVNLKSYNQLNSDSTGTCEWRVILDNNEAGPNLPLQLEITERSFEVLKVEVFDGEDSSSRILSPYPLDVYQATGNRMFVRIVYQGYISLQVQFNATVKVKGYCPGMFSCGDGENCYTMEEKCDGIINCYNTVADEKACAGCPVNQYWCGDSPDSIAKCYSDEERCNHTPYCPYPFVDEKDCTSCKPGTILCPGSGTCIVERRVCDGIKDCYDGSDEKDCYYAASRRVITAAIIGSLVCGLLFVIALGCTCKLYSLRMSHHRRINLYRSTPLSRVERELFQREAPPTYDMTVEGSATEAETRSARRQRRQRSSRRYQFRRAAPSVLANNNITSPQTTEGNEPRQNSRDHEIQDNTTSNTNRDRISLVLDSVPGIISELLFSGGQNSNNLQDGVSNPPVLTRDSETQTQCSNSSSVRLTSTTATSTTTTASTSASCNRRSNLHRTRSEGSSSRHSNRSSSRRRSRRSKDDQARQLPKKKAIAPVMHPAPYLADAVEDTTNCVYPLPPSYDQAILNSPNHEDEEEFTLNRSASLPSLSTEETEGSPSKNDRGKQFFKNPISALLSMTPKQSSTKKLFNFRLRSPRIFQSDPGYSRMDDELNSSTLSDHSGQQLLHARRISAGSSSDDDIIDITLRRVLPQDDDQGHS